MTERGGAARAVRAEFDAVVCGAGVAGLATACALGRLGARVLLLDKRPEPARVAKGEVLQPSSLRILREWGVLSGVLDRGGVRLDRLLVREPGGGLLMSFDYAQMPGPDRCLISLDYPDILAALAAGLPESVRCRRGALVEELLRDPAGRVSGVEYSADGRRCAASAPLVVAADGLSSRLRRLAGLPAQPAEYAHRLVSFEIEGAPPPGTEVSAYISTRGLRLAYPLPRDRVRLYVQVTPDELRGRGVVESLADRLAADTPALEPLLGPMRRCLRSRQILTTWRFTAARLTVPGLALVGESAHSVHPMAAQGMNTAIADAEALAAEFALAAGPAGPAFDVATVDRVLPGYQERRAPSIRHVDMMSHDATRMITSTAPAARWLGRRVLRRTYRNPRLRYLATYNLAGLGIRPFTLLDRLHQAGLPDPRAHATPGRNGGDDG